MATLEEKNASFEERMLQRPDVEWLNRPGFHDRAFFYKLEKRLSAASKYISPERLATLTEDQIRTRIGKALHVYSMWSGRIRVYEGISPLLPQEFRNTGFSGIFGRARVILQGVDDLGRAIHTAIHAKNLKPEDFPEESYGFGAVQLRLMELRDRGQYLQPKTDEYLVIPSTGSEVEEALTIDRDISPEEINEIYLRIKRQQEQETPLTSLPAEEYLEKMDQLTRTYDGVSFDEALYKKAGISQRQAREVLRHLDTAYPDYTDLHRQQYEIVLRITGNSTDQQWEKTLLQESAPSFMSSAKVVEPRGRADTISEQEFSVLRDALSTLSPKLAEFISSDDFVFYARSAGGGQAGIVSGLPYPDNKPFILSEVNHDRNWFNLFNKAHELGHGFHMMFELAGLDQLTNHPFASNYQEKKPDTSTTAEVFSHLAVSIFLDELLAKLEVLPISESERLVLEVKIRLAFERSVIKEIFSVSEHEVDPQYLGYAFGIEVAETKDTQAALDRMEEGTLPNYFANMNAYGYIYEGRFVNGKGYDTYLPLPGQSLPEEEVNYNREAVQDNAIGQGELYARHIVYASKTSNLARHIAHDQLFADLPYQIAVPAALGLWSIAKRVIDMGKLTAEDVQNLWEDLAANHNASFQEIMEMALKRINDHVGMKPQIDFTTVYGMGMKAITNNKRSIVDCLTRLEKVGLPTRDINLEQFLEMV